MAIDVEPRDGTADRIEKTTPDNASLPPKSDDGISADAQAGVQAVEATTIVWVKWHLAAAYGMYVRRPSVAAYVYVLC